MSRCDETWCSVKNSDDQSHDGNVLVGIESATVLIVHLFLFCSDEHSSWVSHELDLNQNKNVRNTFSAYVHLSIYYIDQMLPDFCRCAYLEITNPANSSMHSTSSLIPRHWPTKLGSSKDNDQILLTQHP